MKHILSNFRPWWDFKNLEQSAQFQQSCNPLIVHDKKNGALFLLSNTGIAMVPYNNTIKEGV